MTERIFIGIDPGKQGAIAVLYPEGPALHDMPDTSMLATLFRQLKVLPWPLYVAVEEQTSRPNQSSPSTFTHARDYGAILGILTALQIPYETVRPQRWMRQLAIPSGADKAKHIEVAQSMFPSAVLHGPRNGAKDGRADALLIAESIRRMKTGEK